MLVSKCHAEDCLGVVATGLSDEHVVASAAEAVLVEKRITSQSVKLCERRLHGSSVGEIGLARHKLTVVRC